MTMEALDHRYDEDHTLYESDPSLVPRPTLTPAHAGSHLADEAAAKQEHHESLRRQRSHDNVTRLADGYHLLGQLLQKLAHIENIAGRSELARQVVLAVEPYIERYP